MIGGRTLFVTFDICPKSISIVRWFSIYVKTGIKIVLKTCYFILKLFTGATSIIKS